MRLFPARFGGLCNDGGECDGEFEAGDMIGYDENDDLCCRACLSAARSELDEGVQGWKDFGRE